MARKSVAKAPHSQNVSTSTAYSRARYAHTFYLTAAPDARQPINGDTRMTQWSKKQLGLVPPVTGDGVMDLSDIIGSEGVAESERLGEIRFHALGDSGVNHAEEAEKIAQEMADALTPDAAPPIPPLVLPLPHL